MFGFVDKVRQERHAMFGGIVYGEKVRKLANYLGLLVGHISALCVCWIKYRPIGASSEVSSLAG